MIDHPFLFEEIMAESFSEFIKNFKNWKQQHKGTDSITVDELRTLRNTFYGKEKIDKIPLSYIAKYRKLGWEMNDIIAGWRDGYDGV